jgi:ribosomal protein S18 acetylase RimI-like enzyme
LATSAIYRVIAGTGLGVPEEFDRDRMEIAVMDNPIEYTTARTPDELRQILDLQARNHSSTVSPEVMASQGFVTVRHDAAVLTQMNATAPAVIAKAGDQVVGYALVMPRQFASDVPELLSMFEMMETMAWGDRPLRSNPRWFVMGQVCVAEGYRGRGIFDGLYRTMGERYRDRYDFTITEVAARNLRSLRAHERVGFRTLHTYPDPATGEVWHVVVLPFVAGA